MQILAGSLNVEVDAFLHAGYISAYPRTFQRLGNSVLANSQGQLIDVKKAVELKVSKAQVASTSAAEVATKLLQPATMVTDIFGLAIAFFFFAYLISVYYRRIRKIAKPGWRPWVLPGIAMLIFVSIYFWIWPIYECYSLNNLSPPWKNVAMEEYRDPQAATEAIIHALVANGLLGVSIDVRNLAAIQKEVAYPVVEAEYTPGMKYSQKTYGRDGWGKEFSFERLDDRKYRIISAGPDGLFGTKDDIHFVTPSGISTNWELRVGGMYLRIAEGREFLLIHRIKDSYFKLANPEAARILTGTDLFDLLRVDELKQFHGDQLEGESLILEAFKNHRESTQTKEQVSELLFVRFEQGQL